MDVAAKLQLHIPVPPVRPGDAPDFSHLCIPPAGLLERPDPLTDPAEMRDMPFRLVRVLDDAGERSDRGTPAWRRPNPAPRPARR